MKWLWIGSDGAPSLQPTTQTFLLHAEGAALTRAPLILIIPIIRSLFEITFHLFFPCIYKAERVCSQEALFPISPPAAPLKDCKTILHMRCCYLPSLSETTKQVPLSLSDKQPLLALDHLLLVHYEAVFLLRR